MSPVYAFKLGPKINQESPGGFKKKVEEEEEMRPSDLYCRKTTGPELVRGLCWSPRRRVVCQTQRRRDAGGGVECSAGEEAWGGCGRTTAPHRLEHRSRRLGKTREFCFEETGFEVPTK